jgi:DNA-directed RNA polymerase subunit RPC12/RpoP
VVEYSFKGGDYAFKFQCGDCGELLSEAQANTGECTRCGVIKSSVLVYAKPN